MVRRSGGTAGPQLKPTLEPRERQEAAEAQDAKALVEQTEALLHRLDSRKLPADRPLLDASSREALAELRGAELRIQTLAVPLLQQVADGQLSPAAFTSQMIHACAREAERLPLELPRPFRNARFVELVRSALSAGPFWAKYQVAKSVPKWARHPGLEPVAEGLSVLWNGACEASRRLLTGGGRTSGGVLDEALRKAAQPGRPFKGVDIGFNPGIIDSEKPGVSTVNHHFAEYIGLAFRWGGAVPAVGDAVAAYRDPRDENPGDYRSALFSLMVGTALGEGEILPSTAADLFDLAYLEENAARSPWGLGRETDPRFLSPSGYSLSEWLGALGR